MGHFCRKWPVKIRDPLSLRHPVLIIQRQAPFFLTESNRQKYHTYEWVVSHIHVSHTDQKPFALHVGMCSHKRAYINNFRAVLMCSPTFHINMTNTPNTYAFHTHVCTYSNMCTKTLCASFSFFVLLFQLVVRLFALHSRATQGAHNVVCLFASVSTCCMSRCVAYTPLCCIQPLCIPCVALEKELRPLVWTYQTYMNHTYICMPTNMRTCKYIY